MIECLSSILGMNHQLRPAVLQLLNFQYVGINIGIVTPLENAIELRVVYIFSPIQE